MEFCPKCKSIMLPVNGNKQRLMRCRKCGEEITFDGNHLVSKTEVQEKFQRVIEDESAGLPTTRVKCPECGNLEAYWWMRQLRSADESEVRFFRCTRCRKTWREYN